MHRSASLPVLPSPCHIKMTNKNSDIPYKPIGITLAYKD